MTASPLGRAGRIRKSVLRTGATRTGTLPTARRRVGLRVGLLVGLLTLVAGCRPTALPESDGRIPVRVFLLLINARQVAFYDWAEQAYEAAHPDVDIILEQFPTTSLKDYEIKLRLRYASGQAPDIWTFRENELAVYVERGLLQPAPPYIERIVRENSANAMIREAPFFDGVCYGITHHAGWTALYYNEAHFREAGLDPDRPPRTWAELLDYAERLTVRRPDGSIERAGISLRKSGYKQGTAEKWLTFFYSAGGHPFNEAGTRSLFDSEAGRAAFGLYQDVLFERHLDDVYVEGDQRGFGLGTVSMFIREDHVIDWLADHYPDLEYGVAPIPPRDTSYASYSSGGAFPMVVSRDAAHPEAAWRFLEFLLQDDVYLRYIRTVRSQPILASIADRPEFADDPRLRVFREQQVYPPPKLPYDRMSLEILGSYVERFSYGHVTAAEALRRLDEEVTAQLRLHAGRTASLD